MTRLARRLRTPAVIVAGLVVTLWTAVGLAVAAPAPSGVELAARKGPSYAQDSAAFRPVSAALVLDLLGSAVAAAPTATGLRSTLTFTPSTPGEPPAVPAPPGPDEDPTQTPPPQPFPILTVSMHADRKTAAQGDQIIYTLRVSNLGRADANNAVLESHIPEGTTLISGDACHGQPVTVFENSSNPGGKEVCTDVGGVVSPSAPGEHGEFWTIRTIAAGESLVRKFTVQVNDATPDGTAIRNHGHVYADGTPYLTSKEVFVRVT